MAVIRAYFDDSGDPDDPTHSFLTIAGYVAELGDWKRFEGYWDRAQGRDGKPSLSGLGEIKPTPSFALTPSAA